MLGFIQLLLLQTTLFVGIVWSSCDIEFASSPSINATVNQTVLVVCRSNCTPIRLVTKQGTDQEEEIRLYTELQPVSDYEYDVGAELLLDASLNNATLICRTFVNGISYEKKSWIRLQESLQSVKNLSITPNATHITFTWMRPLAVLNSVQVNYSIQFFRKNNMLYDQTVTETSFSIPSVCPPCRQSNFSVAPVAEQLRGEAISISNNGTCTEGYQTTMKIKGFTRNHSDAYVRIAFKFTIYDYWCMPFIVTMTAVCLHSNTNKTCQLYNLTSDDNTANLPAHDFCSVSLIPQYNNGYTPPLPHKPFSISLFDTQSITFETISDSRTLCVICDLAPWTRDNTTCTVHIHISEISYKSHTNAHKNSSTGKARACFPGLPTDKQYIVNIAVEESRNQILHSMDIPIDFTSSDNIAAGDIDSEAADSSVLTIVLSVAFTTVAAIMIAIGVFGVILWKSKKVSQNDFETILKQMKRMVNGKTSKQES